MPIYRLLQNSSFERPQIAVMALHLKTCVASWGWPNARISYGTSLLGRLLNAVLIRSTSRRAPNKLCKVSPPQLPVVACFDP
jgi:hypothetical protein